MPAVHWPYLFTQPGTNCAGTHAHQSALALSELKAALLQYQAVTGMKITIEYILIKDQNCGIREARELVKFVHGMQAKVNLIPFNAHPGLPFARPSDEEIRAFQTYLSERSIASPVRFSKGLDVSAACGQLVARTEDSIHLTPKRHRVLRHSHPPYRVFQKLRYQHVVQLMECSIVTEISH